MLDILSKIHEDGEYFPTIKDVRKWHGALNEIIFDGKIPKFREIKIKQLPGQFAAVWPMVCTINKEKRSCHLEISERFINFKMFITILTHEMIHCYQWIILKKMPDHGPTFFEFRSKLKEHSIPLNKAYSRKLFS